jgi:hypothetical protein
MFIFNRSYFTQRLFGSISIGFCAVAEVSAQSPDPTSYGMTSGRLIATSAAVLALIGVIVGAMGVFRPGRIGGIAALAAGLVGTIVGGWVIATAVTFGAGGGRAGGIVALVLGLIALALGGLTLVRYRRTG